MQTEPELQMSMTDRKDALPAKHSPGPWRTEVTGSPDIYDGNYHHLWISGEGGTIAQVFACGNPRRAFKDESLSDMPEPNVGPIATANGRLMAAAPTLLAHLEFAVKLLGAMPALSGTAQVDAMRAAIAAATGEQA
jgi:hypothetical protein